MEENTLKNVDNQTENLSESLENKKKKIVINIKKVYLTSLIWSLGLSFLTIIVLYLVTFNATPYRRSPDFEYSKGQYLMSIKVVQIQSFFGKNLAENRELGYQFQILSAYDKEDLMGGYFTNYTWTKNAFLLYHIRNNSICPYLIIFVGFFILVLYLKNTV